MPPDSARSKTGDRIDIALRILGIVVFLAGIVMIVMVFAWAHDLVTSIDAQLLDVQQVSAQAADEPASGDVVADPGARSLGVTGVSLALQFLGLLVLGWLGAMVSSKGAELASGPNRSSPSAGE